MTSPPLHKIKDVISALDFIILVSEKNNDTSGYFAALYQKVTIKVQEGISAGIFEDGPRMEKLDVVFAKRYIDAYFAYQRREKVSSSWQKVFDLSPKYWPIVLQHLLMGMNAHINFDLGIAAAEISKGKQIHNLQSDFNKINDILASMVMEVQDNLATIWPKLKMILSRTGKADDFLIDFSMEMAREGAWKFACELAASAENSKNDLILIRDVKVADKTRIITSPGLIVNVIYAIIRLGEKGTVSEKIKLLKITKPVSR